MSKPVSQARRWFYYVPFVLAFVLIVSMAVVQGRLSDRWDDSQVDAQRLAARLVDVPKTVGDWVGEDQAQDPEQLSASGAVGHVARTYRNQRTGQLVSVFIVSGHNRDVSLHTPDRCYPAAGYEELGSPTRHSIDLPGGTADFYAAIYQKQRAIGDQSLRIFWSWGHEGHWQTADLPRHAFAGVRGLYKIYLVEHFDDVIPPASESTCLTFAKEVLPAISSVLFVPDDAPPVSSDESS